MGGAASHHDNELVLDVQRLSEPAFAVNDAHQIVAWNDGAERLLGLRAEEMIGRRCYEALTVADGSLCMACRFRPQPTSGPAEASAASRARSARTHARRTADQRKRLNMTTLAAHTRTGQLRFVHLLHDAPGEGEPLGAAPAAPATRAALGAAPSAMVVRCEPLGSGQQLDPADSGTKQRRPATLTQRELEVLRLLGAGHSTDDIAQELSITRVTARNHVNKVLDKLGVNSRLQAVVIASQLQLI